MEVLRRGKTITLHHSGTLPVRKTALDGAVVLALIWGVFVVLVRFFSHPGSAILPYFVALSLLVLMPLILVLGVQEFRRPRQICFDGDKEFLSLGGRWRERRVPFDEISGLEVTEYRLRKKVLLCRLDVRRTSGKRLLLIRDVPEKAVLCSVAESIRSLIRKPLSISPN